MTMCNIFVTDDAVMLLTDTLEYLDGGRPLRLGQAKARVAHNRRFAIAGQGLVSLLAEAAEILGHCECVDVAAVMAADLLPVWRGDLRLGEAMRVVIAGLDAAGSPAAFMLEHRETSPAESALRRLPPGPTLLPSPGDAARLPAEWPDDRLVKLATWQCVHAPKFGLPLAVGGVIHKTTISRAGLDQRVFCVSPDYDELAARLGGDPLAGDVAAWRREGAVEAQPYV